MKTVERYSPPTKDLIREFLQHNRDAASMEITNYVCQKQGREPKFGAVGGSTISQIKDELGIPRKHHQRSSLPLIKVNVFGKRIQFRLIELETGVYESDKYQISIAGMIIRIIRKNTTYNAAPFETSHELFQIVASIIKSNHSIKNHEVDSIVWSYKKGTVAIPSFIYSVARDYLTIMEKKNLKERISKNTQPDPKPDKDISSIEKQFIILNRRITGISESTANMSIQIDNLVDLFKKVWLDEKE